MNSDATQDTLQDGMVTGIVRIVAIKGEKAWVESESQSACGGCAVTKSCGTKAITKYFGKKSVPLEMDNHFNGYMGDRLEVGIKNSTILKVSALIYLLPLLGLIMGGLLGDLLSGSDFFAMVFSLLGLMVGFHLSRSLYVSESFAAAVAPVFLKKLAPLENELPTEADHSWNAHQKS